MNTGAVAAWLRGDLSTGLQRMEQVLQLYRDQGNRGGELTTLFNLCGFARRLGDFERARELADGGLQLARRVGNRRVGNMLLMRRSQLHEAAGQPQPALADAARMLQQIDDGGGDFARIAGLMAQGKALGALGRNDEALAAFEQVGKLARPGSSAAVEALGGVVQAQSARGSTAAALAATEVLLGHLAAPSGIDATEVPGLCLIAHEVLLAAGDARAPALLAQGQRLLREQAARISDAAARRRFLHRPPVNRRLLGVSD
jgi:tetratricopeptide (TPR) repeat protein